SSLPDTDAHSGGSANSSEYAYAKATCAPRAFEPGPDPLPLWFLCKPAIALDIQACEKEDIMASDPIPEPLRNQEVEAHQEPRFAESSDKRPINAVPANSPPPERSETEKPLIVVDNTLQGTARNLGSALRRVSNATREGTESAAQTRAELSQLARKSAESVKTRGTEKVLDARREAVWTLRQARAEAQVVVDELR